MQQFAHKSAGQLLRTWQLACRAELFVIECAVVTSQVGSGAGEKKACLPKCIDCNTLLPDFNVEVHMCMRAQRVERKKSLSMRVVWCINLANIEIGGVGDAFTGSPKTQTGFFFARTGTQMRREVQLPTVSILKKCIFCCDERHS